MKRVTPSLVVAVMALVVLSGCSTIRNTWKDTRKLYKNYVDVDPSIDLTDEGITDKGLQKLARLFSPVDQRVEMFTRVYYTQDNPPEPEWCAQFMADFPWLSGMAVVNKDGAVRLQEPAVALRTLDFAPLLELEDRLSKRKLVANATSDDMGGLIYVAAPFFENNEYAGIIVSWFEPRAIAEASPSPEELYIIQPEAVLWDGGHPEAAQSLVSVGWPSILKSEVQGEMAIAGTRYVWQSRFLGQMQLLYLVEVPTAVEQKPASEQAAPPASGSPEAGDAEKDAGAAPEGTAEPHTSSDSGVAPAM
ncbi:MAG: hypothetical protein GYA47_08855 [Desulfovibrio sp.]|nr:hypothetical protein [Desulfovibrio sp.]